MLCCFFCCDASFLLVAQQMKQHSSEDNQIICIDNQMVVTSYSSQFYWGSYYLLRLRECFWLKQTLISSAMGRDGPHKSYTRLASPVLYFEGRGKILFSFNTCNGSSEIWRKSQYWNKIFGSFCQYLNIRYSCSEPQKIQEDKSTHHPWSTFAAAV